MAMIARNSVSWRLTIIPQCGIVFSISSPRHETRGAEFGIGEANGTKGSAFLSRKDQCFKKEIVRMWVAADIRIKTDFLKDVDFSL